MALVLSQSPPSSSSCWISPAHPVQLGGGDGAAVLSEVGGFFQPVLLPLPSAATRRSQGLHREYPPSTALGRAAAWSPLPHHRSPPQRLSEGRGTGLSRAMSFPPRQCTEPAVCVLPQQVGRGVPPHSTSSPPAPQVPVTLLSLARARSPSCAFRTVETRVRARGTDHSRLLPKVYSPAASAPGRRYSSPRSRGRRRGPESSQPAEGGRRPLLDISGAVGVHLQGVHDLVVVQQQLHQQVLPLRPHRGALQRLHQLQLQQVLKRLKPELKMGGNDVTVGLDQRRAAGPGGCKMLNTQHVTAQQRHNRSPSHPPS